MSCYGSPSLRRQKNMSRKNILLTQNCFSVSNFNMWFWELCYRQHKNRFVLVASVVLRSNSSTAWARFSPCSGQQPRHQSLPCAHLDDQACILLWFSIYLCKHKVFDFLKQKFAVAVEWLLLQLTRKVRGLWKENKKSLGYEEWNNWGREGQN